MFKHVIPRFADLQIPYIFIHYPAILRTIQVARDRNENVNFGYCNYVSYLRNFKGAGYE